MRAHGTKSREFNSHSIWLLTCLKKNKRTIHCSNWMPIIIILSKWGESSKGKRMNWNITCKKTEMKRLWNAFHSAEFRWIGCFFSLSSYFFLLKSLEYKLFENALLSWIFAFFVLCLFSLVRSFVCLCLALRFPSSFFTSLVSVASAAKERQNNRNVKKSLPETTSGIVRFDLYIVHM